jgi:hypothetical protein
MDVDFQKKQMADRILKTNLQAYKSVVGYLRNLDLEIQR